MYVQVPASSFSINTQPVMFRVVKYLYIDNYYTVIGGWAVCLAHYLNVDPCIIARNITQVPALYWAVNKDKQIGLIHNVLCKWESNC